VTHEIVGLGLSFRSESDTDIKLPGAQILFQYLQAQWLPANEIPNDPAPETSSTPKSGDLDLIQPHFVFSFFDGESSNRSTAHQNDARYLRIPFCSEQLPLKLFVPRAELALDDLSVDFGHECVGPIPITFRALSAFVPHFLRLTVLFGLSVKP
jgi:hypothetical protein